MGYGKRRLPTGAEKTTQIATASPPIQGDFGRFTANGGVFLEASGTNWRKSSIYAGFSLRGSLHIMRYR